MIYSLKVTDPDRLPTPWWSKTESLCKIDTFEFGAGVNILWGRNAQGKSTILQLLAQWFHCYQGGRSLVTDSSLRASIKQINKGKGYVSLDGAEIKHDGKPVAYFNPEKVVGVCGSELDDDFIDEGIRSVFLKGSSGQHTIEGMITAVKSPEGDTIPWTMKKEAVNDLWAGWIAGVEAMLAPNAPSGPRTILLDEPDRSLDLDNAAEVWRQLPRGRTPRQLIVATHSPFALNIAGAKYIELTPGYLDKCRELLRIGEKA
jgi:predicted ATPase